MFENLAELAAATMKAAPDGITDPKGEQIAAILEGCSVAVVMVIFAGLISGALVQMEDEAERAKFMMLLNFMVAVMADHEHARKAMH